MKQNFQVDEFYYICFKGNNVTSFSGGELIRFYIDNFEYRSGNSLSFQQPTDAQKQTYAYVGIHYSSNDDRIKFYLIDENVSSIVLWHQFTLSTKLELYGEVSNVTQASVLLQPYAIQDPQEITFYKLECEMNRVDKTSYLDSPYKIYGAFKENVDVMNPVIIVQYERAVMLSYNYVFIHSLNERYYFIDNIICVRQNVFEIHLHVDVLMSYKTDLLDQVEVYVLRTGIGLPQSLDQDIEITADDRVNFASYYVPTYTLKTDTPSESTKKNVTFDVSISVIHGAVACLINDLTPLTPSSIVSPDSGYLPNIVSREYSNPLTFNYFLNDTQVKDLIEFVKDSSSRTSKVVSLMTFPFRVRDVEQHVDLDDPRIRLGDEYVKNLTYAIVTALPSDLSSYLVLADFTATPRVNDYYLKWMNYEPYAYHELFLPYYGWISVNGKDIVNQRIIVYYAVNYQTGNAQVNVYNMTTHKIIFTGVCQLGIKIPISVSNAEENAVERANNGTNLALGVIGGAISTGIGVATMNPVAIVGGALSLTSSIAKGITGENAIFDRVNGQVSSGNSGMYMPQEVIYKVSFKPQHSASDITNSSFSAINGAMVNNYMDVSDCSGHTEIGLMHYAPSIQTYILKPEIEEIETLARNGIIL